MLIKVTNSHGTGIHLNASHIAKIEPHHAGGCVVYLAISKDDGVMKQYVTENTETVASRVLNAYNAVR